MFLKNKVNSQICNKLCNNKKLMNNKMVNKMQKIYSTYIEKNENPSTRPYFLLCCYYFLFYMIFPFTTYIVQFLIIISEDL